MFCYFMSILVFGKRERELDALLSLSSWCHMRFVLVIFPNHTQLLFWGVIHANSDGFGESEHLLGLVLAIVTVQILMWLLKWRLNANLCEQRRLWRVCTFAQAYLSLRHCTKSLVLPKMAICVLFMPAANTLVSLHICAGKVTGQCDKNQDLLCWQRRLLGVCTLSQARLSLRHSIEIYHVLAEIAIFVTFM